MREKLASVERVLNVTKHPNADTLDIVTIQGWKCITRLGEFKKDDLIVYCQIDSVLPETPDFEFLKDYNCSVNNGVVKGYRIKTKKLRGEYSQGLILPLSVLDGKKFPNDERESPTYDWVEGKDVTTPLGIVQFERPIPIYLMGKVKGDFPSFIPKSDETRVQVLQGLLDEYNGTECYVTEKVDGTSCTMFYRDGEFGVCSRNLELAPDDSTFHERPKYALNGNGKYQQIHTGDGELFGDEFDTIPEPSPIKENVYWKMAREYGVKERLMQFPHRKLAIQGEIYGEGLQGNPLKVKGQHYAIFSIYDISEQKYLTLSEMQEVIYTMNLMESVMETKDKNSIAEESKFRKIEMVPIVEEGYILENVIDLLVEKSKGKSVLNPQRPREGIVIRPVSYVQNNNYSEVCKAGRISFKSINPEYLIKNDE